MSASDDSEDEKVRKDPADRLPAYQARRWAVDEKLVRLRKYVGITAAVRRKYLPPRAGSAYIDLYCGPGRVWLKEDGSFHDGSPLVALKESQRTKAPFSECRIGDLEKGFVTAAETRLKAAGAANVVTEWGEADQTVGKLIKGLNPAGLHLAFLDPFALGPMPFAVIDTLGKNLQRVDLLVHVSLMDLQRNLEKFFSGSNTALDRFAPGWRSAVPDRNAAEALIRSQIMQHWLGLVRRLGFDVFDHALELVTGTKNQNLYWLVLASRHERAHELWNKIRSVSGQGSLAL